MKHQHALPLASSSGTGAEACGAGGAGGRMGA
eukprot:CAMPEP_0174334436 /NCGR_PEP_ID=MMETSP0810-20121108/19924_1 /TAXON_ID=73025 ORGANISM="Eutreptiella gymnastica-like, Strain CCMP1594" /NCGR_SAMPLE_ID=MMETSP0810 /ASSEMBLY_ACC=CAM_ASM_000659 /LENGTH=31 /DNA_ID= /DNA_START= /DNA_END= /DNA_ORIENTATION=